MKIRGRVLSFIMRAMQRPSLEQIETKMNDPAFKLKSFHTRSEVFIRAVLHCTGDIEKSPCQQDRCEQVVTRSDCLRVGQNMLR